MLIYYIIQFAFALKGRCLGWEKNIKKWKYLLALAVVPIEEKKR